MHIHLTNPEAANDPRAVQAFAATQSSRSSDSSGAHGLISKLKKWTLFFLSHFQNCYAVKQIAKASYKINCGDDPASSATRGHTKFKANPNSTGGKNESTPRFLPRPHSRQVYFRSRVGPNRKGLKRCDLLERVCFYPLLNSAVCIINIQF
jgi:hypothetical protein